MTADTISTHMKTDKERLTVTTTLSYNDRGIFIYTFKRIILAFLLMPPIDTENYRPHKYLLNTNILCFVKKGEQLPN